MAQDVLCCPVKGLLCNAKRLDGLILGRLQRQVEVTCKALSCNVQSRRHILYA